MLFNNYKYRVVLFGFFDIADVIVDALRIGIAPYGAKMCFGIFLPILGS